MLQTNLCQSAHECWSDRSDAQLILMLQVAMELFLQMPGRDAEPSAYEFPSRTSQVCASTSPCMRLQGA